METGEIRIGASDMTLQFYLLPHLQRFHERYPGHPVQRHERADAGDDALFKRGSASTSVS